MVNTYIVDKDGNQADASTVTVPANRDFRGAWVTQWCSNLRRHGLCT